MRIWSSVVHGHPGTAWCDEDSEYVNSVPRKSSRPCYSTSVNNSGLKEVFQPRVALGVAARAGDT
jgi:hypothetical protein